MYDYISIYSDAQYRNKIQTTDLRHFLITYLDFVEVDTLRFSKEIEGEHIRATGILADANGNYAFDTLENINEVNLLEIVIPNKLTYSIEEKIISIAKAIEKQFSWIIDLRE